ncbi:3-oxoadipate enol-lactonase [Uruburuella testudinis]|uniref:3-oxoadipate enol-lactonase n=1 Tax=Uruburuella testudinis TaxID=1282863 RepID=A0ABY4DPE6_9NEIS|nr:3-oxoadipate enol-lactonase [Uruburuella testudinis]UOO80928.1 3-oxoadipate enol-lactonase [Uruburuella testudinis]
MWIHTHDGNRLYARSFGDEQAPALIFCNSLGTDHSMWQPQIDALSTDYRVIVYDTRGHGHSSAKGGSWTLADLGRDVISVLDGFNIPTAGFCGISMGGLTGLWLALHHAERFNRIIISNTAAKIGNTEAWSARARSVRSEGMNAIADSAASRWFSDDFCRRNAAAVARLTEILRHTPAEGYAKCCEILAAADLRPHIHTAKSDILVIGGTADPVTTPDDAQWLASTLPHATLAVLPASHIANIEAAEEFNRLLHP